MRRREFILSMSAIPAAGLLPLPNGKRPSMFRGCEIRWPGLYQVALNLEGVGPDGARVMLDEAMILSIVGASSGPVRAVARGIFYANHGQLLHVDVYDPGSAVVELRVDCLGRRGA